MDKRYQVFISSTYADLHDERQEVMQALLELDCIPSGMELFPAANEDQWSLIQKVIDDCDYYIVIVAGRYGSIGLEGVSYTEMEYSYAVKVGKPVLGFVHRDPGVLPSSRCESSEEGKVKLNAFRELVQKKMCRFWGSPADLGSQVSRSLIKQIRNAPGVGWVRGDLVPDESVAEEILSLRRRIEELQAELFSARETGPEGASNLAQGEDLLEVSLSFTDSRNRWSLDEERYSYCVMLEWNKIFSALSPLMIHEAPESELLNALNALLAEIVSTLLESDDEFRYRSPVDVQISDNDFQTIKIQLRALGLINKSNRSRSVRDKETNWTLTPYGDSVMTRLRAIRK